MSLFRAALDGLVPYEPGKPEEEVQRELGLERVVKLASNEGPWGPFPAALEALERSAGSLNRYPDGGAFHLRNAIAERHGVEPANVITGAGADAIIGHLSVAALDPGDEVVTAHSRSVPSRRGSRSSTTTTTWTRCSPRLGPRRSSSTSRRRTTPRGR